MEKDVGKTDEKLDKLEAELLDRKREADRYRSVIEHQTELICRYLRDGTLTFVNDAYCRFFGMKREDSSDSISRTSSPNRIVDGSKTWSMG